MAVPNDGGTTLPSDSASSKFQGLWDGSAFRAWRGDANGSGKVLLVDANGNTLVKAEDAAHASGDPGIQALAVRKDIAVALAGTDGDYIPLITDANGRLHVVQVPLVKILTADRTTPVPTNSDLLNASGGALVSGDFQIRDTSFHYIIIPLLDSGFSKFCIEIYAPVTFDKAINFELRGQNSSANNITGTFSAGFSRYTLASAYVGANPSTFGASNGWSTTPYANNWTGLSLLYYAPSGSGAPTTGEFQFKITRAT